MKDVPHRILNCQRQSPRPIRSFSESESQTVHEQVARSAGDLLPAIEWTSKQTSKHSTIDARGDAHWWNENHWAIVLEQQPRVAIYQNADGDIVLRQEDPSGCTCGDPFVVLKRQDEPRVIAALCGLARNLKRRAEQVCAEGLERCDRLKSRRGDVR
jgi:hypothetical protein